MGQHKYKGQQAKIDNLCKDTPKEAPIEKGGGKRKQVRYGHSLGGLLPMQEKFVYEYVKDWDRLAAMKRAGYNVENENSAAVTACRLLKMPQVMEMIDEIQCSILATHLIDANWAIVRFKLTYMKAINDRDYGNALRALENISKFLGLYERHNKQKKYSVEDVEELRNELEMAGFNFGVTAKEKEMIAARITVEDAKTLIPFVVGEEKPKGENSNGQPKTGDK